MTLSKELLEILACPKCKGEVNLLQDGAKSSAQLVVSLILSAMAFL
jgi:uncharacterized protein YbaR (Trm112 family)